MRFTSEDDAGDNPSMTVKRVNLLQSGWIVDEDFMAFIAHGKKLEVRRESHADD